MPLFMDRHDMQGVSAVDAAKAHVRDLEVQDRYDVRYLSYWFDYERQASFCLVDSPSAEAAEAVHRESHGMLAHKIIQVDPAEVQSYLGAIPREQPGKPYVATAFRAILFTDIEGSTVLTQRLGDAGAMGLLRRHDEVVRQVLRMVGGSEVKHTGDGIMASFASVGRAVECAIEIQRRLAMHGKQDPEQAIRLRIGLSAGEPVTQDADLFGAAVQLAARLCSAAEPTTILVSGVVRELCIGKGFVFLNRGELNLRGFDEPVRAYAVHWEQIPT
jgi:class 3 adenylate cyclase